MSTKILFYVVSIAVFSISRVTCESGGYYTENPPDEPSTDETHKCCILKMIEVQIFCRWLCSDSLHRSRGDQPSHRRRPGFDFRFKHLIHRKCCWKERKETVIHLNTVCPPIEKQGYCPSNGDGYECHEECQKEYDEHEEEPRNSICCCKIERHANKTCPSYAPPLATEKKVEKKTRFRTPPTPTAEKTTPKRPGENKWVYPVRVFGAIGTLTSIGLFLYLCCTKCNTGDCILDNADGYVSESSVEEYDLDTFDDEELADKAISEWYIERDCRRQDMTDYIFNSVIRKRKVKYRRKIKDEDGENNGEGAYEEVTNQNSVSVEMKELERKAEAQNRPLPAVPQPPNPTHETPADQHTNWYEVNETSEQTYDVPTIEIDNMEKTSPQAEKQNENNRYENVRQEARPSTSRHDSGIYDEVAESNKDVKKTGL